MNDQKIKAQQSIASDIPSMVGVLLLPFMMISLASRTGGIVIGLLILGFFLFWFVVLYNKIYRKTLIISDDYILYENKEFSKLQTMKLHYNEIKQINQTTTLMNNLTQCATIHIKLQDDTKIQVMNIKNGKEIYKILQKNMNKAI